MTQMEIFKDLYQGWNVLEIDYKGRVCATYNFEHHDEARRFVANDYAAEQRRADRDWSCAMDRLEVDWLKSVHQD